MIRSGGCVVVDCRFDFAGPALGRERYLAGHIPGAFYANLDNDLSSSVTDQSGRHPLPEPGAFAHFLSRIGWRPDTLLVAYDERNNTVAGRLWWLMRYFGRDAALLNGGLEAWTGAGYSLQGGDVAATASELPRLQGNPEMVTSTAEIVGNLQNKELTVLDARAAERFSGDTEPLDTKAGHIPGSMNRPMGMNLDASGRFKPAEQLLAEFKTLLGESPPSGIVHSCGSGVTACHNQFAMELAGLDSSKVYPGSWSEWIRDDSRPIEKGHGP